ncbi:MAG: hypothetical protein EKK63_11375 [Acinetobacter sp.]|nr:MAG: hypothetical protein EKK63_11375 [Acinetobacter sp.]
MVHETGTVAVPAPAEFFNEHSPEVSVFTTDLSKAQLEFTLLTLAAREEHAPPIDDATPLEDPQDVVHSISASTGNERSVKKTKTK